MLQTLEIHHYGTACDIPNIGLYCSVIEITNKISNFVCLMSFTCCQQFMCRSLYVLTVFIWKSRVQIPVYRHPVDTSAWKRPGENNIFLFLQLTLFVKYASECLYSFFAILSICNFEVIASFSIYLSEKYVT